MSESDQTIDYDALTKDALRGVVKKVLRDIEKHGLPGEHHLFISFDTRADGVIISKRLREEYPEEMTVVLQHRFWDLEIHQDRFQVKLTFNAIPERLTVPFAALKVFYDPSVPFGLQFTTSDVTVENIRRSPVLSEVTNPSGVTGFPMVPNEFDQAPLESLASQMSDISSGRETVRLDEDDEANNSNDEADRDKEIDSDAETGSAEIVELDHFRKR